MRTIEFSFYPSCRPIDEFRSSIHQLPADGIQSCQDNGEIIRGPLHIASNLIDLNSSLMPIRLSCRQIARCLPQRQRVCDE
jgi:hypothetical protein